MAVIDKKSLYVKYIYTYKNGSQIIGCTQHLGVKDMSIEIENSHIQGYSMYMPSGEGLLQNGVQLHVLTAQEVATQLK
jgi:hypothetical protein